MQFRFCFLFFLISRNRTSNTPEVNGVSIQAQQIGERIRSRGRSASSGIASTTSTSTASSTTVTDATTTAATTEVPITTTTTSAPVTTIQTVADVVQQESTTVAPTLIETSSAVTAVPDDSSITLFPEGAIVLGFSSSTEISEVIQIVGELPPRSSRNVSNDGNSNQTPQ